MATYDFKDLDVWKRSMDLVVATYQISNKLPQTEVYALTDQIRRAVVSVPSNIAEGQRRSSVKEVIQFSSIALGSLAEVETQLIIAHRIYNVDVNELLGECEIISRMLRALIKSLRLK